MLLATYNGERFLGEQLDSLLSQTVDDFEIFAHDDGSTDGTISILDEYKIRFGERLHIIEGKPLGGAKENFWFLLKNVEADVYFFCDQDDVWLPHKIEKERKELISLGGDPASAGCHPAVVFSDMLVCNEDLSVRAPSFLSYIGRDARVLTLGRVLLDNPAAGTSMAFNLALRSLAASTDFDLSGVEMHDGFLLLLAIACGKCRFIEEPLVCYRQHGTNEMGAAGSESVSARIFRNISDVVSGSFFEKKRFFFSLSIEAARQLLKLEALPSDTRELLRGYAGIRSLSKLKRIAFLRKNGFNRAKHTWWMYLIV